MSVYKKIQIDNFEVGQKLHGKVINITPFGAFVDVGKGQVGMIRMQDFSVARIKSPEERVKIGQEIDIVVKSIDREKERINLSYKEAFGTWEENANKFAQGMKTKGIIRETEKNKNGIFIELAPNLVGMSEYAEGLEYGQDVDVLIKKIDYEKQKVKLVLI